MAGHNSLKVVLQDTAQTLVGTASNTVVSSVFKISDLDRRACVFDIIPGTSISGTATAKLQTSQDGVHWVDSKTAALAGTAVSTIKLLDTDVTNDAAFLPLRPLGRVVVTTSSAAGSISQIYFSTCE